MRVEQLRVEQLPRGGPLLLPERELILPVHRRIRRCARVEQQVREVHPPQQVLQLLPRHLPL